MRKSFSVLLFIVFMILTACGTKTNSPSNETEKIDEPESVQAGNSIQNEKQSVNEESDEEEVEEVEEVEEQEEKTLTEKELYEAIEKQPLKVIKTNYLVQDENLKTLYPDMLQAIIENNSGVDIKDAIVAFVAWDENNLPIKIKGNVDFSDGAYVRLVQYNDINLVDGQSYGENSGYEISDEINVEKFKAIVVSYEGFEGEKWENELFDDFVELFEGVKYKE